MSVRKVMSTGGVDIKRNGISLVQIAITILPQDLLIETAAKFHTGMAPHTGVRPQMAEIWEIVITGMPIRIRITRIEKLHPKNTTASPQNLFQNMDISVPAANPQLFSIMEKNRWSLTMKYGNCILTVFKNMVIRLYTSITAGK